MANLRYRRDVDGLRAVAIIPVVAFHAGIPFFNGGFVGVDVFFVISGYLITRLLYDELERSGRINFPNFYAKRARRLFPALAVVCLATLTLGFWLLLPFGEQQDLAKSTMATSVFSSNVYFWMQSGYFDGPADLKPLLNMWSLAVEEQFYLIWPLLLLILWQGRGFGARAAKPGECRNPLRGVLMALALVATISFSSSFWLTGRSQVTAFYMMPMRAWEFALGGMIALSPSPGCVYRPIYRVLAQLAGILGLGLIGWSVLNYSRATPFPGAAALVPVLGTMLVLLSGQTGGGLAYRLLTLRWVVIIGLLSYSWYLWHWPLMALARSYDFGQHDLLRDTFLAAAALVLAALTYRWVENPLRRSQTGLFSTTNGALLAGSGLLLLVLLCGGAMGGWAKYLAQSSGKNSALLAAMRDRQVVTPKCDIDVLGITFRGALPLAEYCQFGGSNSRLLLWGDSYAEHYAPLLDRLGRNHGLGVMQRVLGGCPPVLGVIPFRAGVPHEDCRDFNELVARELPSLREKGIDGAILSANWLMQDPEGLEGLASGLARTLAVLDRHGFKVLLVAPSVEFPIPVPLCLARKSIDQCGVTQAAFETRREKVLTVINSVTVRNDNVRIYDPVNSLCSREYCPPILNGVIGYRDSGHLAMSALSVLYSDWESEIKWLTR